MYDYLVVGAGMFGSVFAHQMKNNKKSVLVIDKRPHIAGNCYTSNHEGINLHVYGPHIFHTSDKGIWQFVNQFAEFNNYVNRPKVSYKGKIFSFPINLMTLHQLWGVETPEEAKKKLDEVKIPCADPRNLEEWILSQVGREVYETFVYGYTKKQWMREPKDLPAFIMQRLPIRLNFDDNYFNDTFQGIPVGGYTEIFEKLLDGCDVSLEEDYFANRSKWDKIAKRIVYTGKIDEFFDYEKGELDYRTLRFEHNHRYGDFQGTAVVNYTEESVPFTRITEHKYFQPQNLHKTPNTIWTKEFPEKWTKESIPYYPVMDERSSKILSQYKEAANSLKNVIFGGRLAEFKYFDMHQVIGSALKKAKIESENFDE